MFTQLYQRQDTARGAGRQPRPCRRPALAINHSQAVVAAGAAEPGVRRWRF
jgi:hypothetical protein